MQTTGAPEEQLAAEPLFETLDLLAQSRLRNMERFCGSSKVPQFAKFQERAQFCNLEGTNQKLSNRANSALDRMLALLRHFQQGGQSKMKAHLP